MSQGLIIFIVIGAILSYILLGFVDKIDGDEEYASQEEMISQEDRSYHQKDTIGQTMLIFKGGSLEKKLGVWNRSPLKEEFMDYFPNFLEMKNFINDRIVDADFQKILIKRVSDIEDAFFSGDITQDEAISRLKTLEASE